MNGMRLDASLRINRRSKVMTEVPFADRAQEAMTASPKSSKVSGQRENTASKSVLSTIVTPGIAIKSATIDLIDGFG